MSKENSACLLVAGVSLAHHDGTDHPHEEEHKALIMLEIEPNVKNSTSSKDKRSPQHQSSQAVFGASPGQFVVRTASEDSSQPEVPPEYLSLLQQLVAQQEQSAGAEATPQQPVINQLLIARNPDPSAVQFTNVPGQPQRPRRPPSPQAQLQQLYFNSQFQQQIPVRPRILRPRPAPQPSQDDFATLSATGSRVHSIHEARLRASLAGTDPDLAVQALGQQQILPASASTPSPLYDEQLTQFATASQDHVSQLQTLPQQAISQQNVYTANPQIQYVQQPQPVQRAASYPSGGRQSAPSAQHISAERSKLSRRPAGVPAPQQYLRETTQPIPEQTISHAVRQQETSDPKVYLTSQEGHQTPESNHDEDELISQLLSGGRGLFPGASSTPATAAEEIIRSTTALPPTPSRSSIYVTQTSNLKSSGGRSKITIEDVDTSQEDSKTPIPVVHLPTPDGQRPLTQTELQALIDAGFNIQPAPEESTPAQSIASQYFQQTTTKSVSPQYYQQTTKKQRSYVTPAPPRNQVSYESRLKKPQEEKEEIRFVQHVSAQEEEISQRAQLNSRYRLQGSKPQQQEEVVQIVRQRPPPPQDPGHRQGSQYTRFRIVVNNPEPEEYQFIQIPASHELQEQQQREQLSTYETQSEEAPQTTQYHRFQAQRESIAQQLQTTRYQPDNTESQEQTYHTEPQQTTVYQREETEAPQVTRFHQPIVVPELPTTTPVPRTTPRRRRPRPPTHSRIVFRNEEQGQAQEEAQSSPNVPQRFLVAYDNVPEASSFGTRNRVRARRPNPTEES